MEPGETADFESLIAAAEAGDLNHIIVCREHGTNLHLQDEAVLKAAVGAGHADIVRFLHEDGANLSACESEAVQKAIERGHWPALHYLFSHGCKVPAALADASRLDPASNLERTDRAVAAARENLTATLRDRSNETLPDAGPRWGTYSQWGRAVIPHLKTPRDVTRFAQHPHGHGGFESRQRGDELVAYATARERHLCARFPDYADRLASFTESDLSDSETTVLLNGRRVSGPMYANTTFFLECISRVPQPKAVCEIGGGYGGPSRLWLTNSIHRPNPYVIVDLAESLFFSEVFLRTELGFENVDYVRSATPIPAGDMARFRVVLCPVNFIDALEDVEFDLVYNTLSMQEMSEPYVDFYMEWLDRQRCRYFYSFNYAAQPIDQHPESANRGVPRLSARWRPVWIAPQAAGPSPALHIVAEKHCARPETTPGMGEQLLADVMQKDLDPATLMTLMFAARMCDSAAVTFLILDKIADEMPYLPRETLILLDSLGSDARSKLSRRQNDVVDRIAASLQDRSAGSEVSPHLSALRSSYIAASRRPDPT